MLGRIAALAASLLILAVSSYAQGLEVLSDRSSGRTFALRVTPPTKAPGATTTTPSAAALRATADAFIAEHRELIGIADPDHDLLASPAETDRLGLSRVLYFQRYRGLDVRGGGVSVHMNRAGQVTYVKTKVARDLPAETTSQLTETQARDAALRAASAKDGGATPTILSAQLLIMPIGIARNEPSDATHLSWEVDVADSETKGLRISSRFYFDAITGALLLESSLTQSIYRQIVDLGAETGNRMQMNGHDVTTACLKVLPDGCGAETDIESSLFPPYVFGRSEGKPARGPYPNPSPSPYYGYYGTSDGDSLYERLGEIHDYFYEHYGLNGANNLGGAVRAWGGADPSITQGGVHLDSGVVGDWGCPNAVYSHPTGWLAFCLGTVTDDVVGHEYFHAVELHANPFMQYLIPGGQTGALMEASSDFMGEMFEQFRTGTCDWNNGASAGILPGRDLANPESIVNPGTGLPYPDRFNSPSFYCGSADDEGEHYNSTVFSHALYLMSEGGAENGCTIQGQGKTATERILVRAWQTYFSWGMNFNEAYGDMIQSCTDLYPSSVAEVTKALQAVELDQPGYCTGIPAVPPPCQTVSVGDVPLSVGEGIRLLSSNPARSNIHFAYRTPHEGRVEATIIDLAGRVLARPVRAYQLAGEQRGAWDGRGEGGDRLKSGAYFLIVRLDGQPLGTRKLLLLE